MTQRHKPRLCIGLPVYNGEEYLAQAVESVLGQTFDDFRLIISDNASTDGTEEICRSYAQRDSRVEYHRVGENRGAAWNFNRVVGLADSEYFQWATHDDVWAHLYANDVPYNPLHEQGYPSIGCQPCTSPVVPGENLRAGRWRGAGKNECGLHTPLRGNEEKP